MCVFYCLQISGFCMNLSVVVVNGDVGIESGGSDLSIWC